MFIIINTFFLCNLGPGLRPRRPSTYVSNNNNNDDNNNNVNNNDDNNNNNIY